MINGERNSQILVNKIFLRIYLNIWQLHGISKTRDAKSRQLSEKNQGNFIMTSSTTTPTNATWPLNTDTLAAEISAFETVTRADADAMPVELGARAPLAALAMLRDSLNILSAFSIGKGARLSRGEVRLKCAS